MLLLESLQIKLVLGDYLGVLERIFEFISSFLPGFENESLDILIGQLILTSNDGRNDAGSNLVPAGIEKCPGLVNHACKFLIIGLLLRVIISIVG